MSKESLRTVKLAGTLVLSTLPGAGGGSILSPPSVSLSLSLLSGVAADRDLVLYLGSTRSGSTGALVLALPTGSGWLVWSVPARARGRRGLRLSLVSSTRSSSGVTILAVAGCFGSCGPLLLAASSSARRVGFSLISTAGLDLSLLATGRGGGSIVCLLGQASAWVPS